jgi:hypothetical protein
MFVFEHACLEWNMHVTHVNMGKIPCHHAAPFPDEHALKQAAVTQIKQHEQ